VCEFCPSNLTMIVFGGTLQSWIDGSNPTTHTEPRAIEIDRSTYHVKPFLTEGSLGPQSRSIDFVVSPGGGTYRLTTDQSGVFVECRSQSGATRGSRPYSRTTEIFDNLQSRRGRRDTRNRGAARWASAFRLEVPVEQRATLVDIDSVRPPLWDIGMPDPPGGTRKRWLALNSNASGPFRAIFSSPTVAANFLAWLRKIRVTRIGQFDLGVSDPCARRLLLTTYYSAMTAISWPVTQNSR